MGKPTPDVTTLLLLAPVLLQDGTQTHTRRLLCWVWRDKGCVAVSKSVVRPKPGLGPVPCATRICLHFRTNGLCNNLTEHDIATGPTKKTLLFTYHTGMGLNSPCRCAMSEIERSLPVKHHQMERETEALTTEECEIALEKAIHGKVDGQGR
jgi:hypothetical protein